MKRILLRVLYALLAIAFLGVLMLTLYSVCVEAINKGFGFVIWLGSLLAFLSCISMALGYKPKFQKRSDKRQR